MSDKMKAMILAASAGGFTSAYVNTSGLHRMEHEEALAELETAGVWFGVRGWLEQDEHFRQIIPYVILVQGDRIVTYTRGASGGEARLHGKLSIGVGGHIDIGDAVHDGQALDLAETITGAAAREVVEEVLIMPDPDSPDSYGPRKVGRLIKWIGLLNDNSDAVGRVHIGLVGVVNLDPAVSLTTAEDSQEDLSFLTVKELRAQADRLEGWTRLALPALDDIINHVDRQ